jgi:hypothetical protein
VSYLRIRLLEHGHKVKVHVERRLNCSAEVDVLEAEHRVEVPRSKGLVEDLKAHSWVCGVLYQLSNKDEGSCVAGDCDSAALLDDRGLVAGEALGFVVMVAELEYEKGKLSEMLLKRETYIGG